VPVFGRADLEVRGEEPPRSPRARCAVAGRRASRRCRARPRPRGKRALRERSTLHSSRSGVPRTRATGRRRCDWRRLRPSGERVWERPVPDPHLAVEVDGLAPPAKRSFVQDAMRKRSQPRSSAARRTSAAARMSHGFSASSAAAASAARGWHTRPETAAVAPPPPRSAPSQHLPVLFPAPPTRHRRLDNISDRFFCVPDLQWRSAASMVCRGRAGIDHAPLTVGLQRRFNPGLFVGRQRPAPRLRAAPGRSGRSVHKRHYTGGSAHSTVAFAAAPGCARVPERNFYQVTVCPVGHIGGVSRRQAP
jgi:hypothetical protein